MECINKVLNNVSNKFNHVQQLIEHHSINWATSKTSTCESQGNRRDKTIATCNPGQSPWNSTAIFIFFLLFLSSLIKQCSVFEIFLAVLPSPTLYKVKTRKKILDRRIQHCLCGEGRGWTCVNWKTPQKCKSVPRLLSMIVDRCSRVHVATDRGLSDLR